VLEPATVAVVAKATNGTDGQDASYANFKAQAEAQGSIFSGYHFLEAGNGAAQAQNYHNVAGSVPCMIDCEQDGSSNPTVQDCLDFWNELKSLGGRVWAVYLPNWYWSGDIGSPDLSPLSSLALVASDYNAYSDSSSGWDSYGNLAPSVLQFSDTFSYSGMQIDFNAYKGTTAQFADLVNGTNSTSSGTTAPPANSTSEEDDDMSQQSENGIAELSWGAGAHSNLQVGYDGPAPILRVVLQLTTGPFVLENEWSPSNGTGVLSIPTQYVAACRGVVFEATKTSVVYVVFAGS
jgi:hypothetical protein